MPVEKKCDCRRTSFSWKMVNLSCKCNLYCKCNLQYKLQIIIVYVYVLLIDVLLQ